MARILSPHVVAALAAILVVLAGAHPASAQTQAGDTTASLDELSNVELLDDFLYYVQINDYQQAARHGEELLRRGPDNQEFLGVVEELNELDRFVEVLARARRVDSIDRLRALADEFESRYERGRRERARQADEITRNIELLNQGSRARLLGAQRLVAAGEYAMPQLLPALLQGSSPGLQIEVQRVMQRLGRHAVMPLVAALPDLSPSQQELVVNLLAQIEYNSWLPYVQELAQSTKSDSVRAACRAAIRLRAGSVDLEGDVADGFYALAERYYAEQSAVTSFPDEQFQLLWSYNPGVGLVATPIRTPVFHEAMAMRLSERSLSHRPESNAALPLWVASNFSRELDTPQGYDNPAYPASRPEAMYFATAFGDANAQWVLARALDTRDTPLARRAIAAIERTAGPEALRASIGSAAEGVAGSEPRSPLIEALDYPNRRVQFEAALALASSRPTEPFEGDRRIIPLLASAIRDARAKVAVVLTVDRERREVLEDTLAPRGYEVIAGSGLDDIAPALIGQPGVNLLVVDMPSGEIERVIESARRDRRLRATPVLALSRGMGFAELTGRFRRDQTVLVRQQGIDQGTLLSALDLLLEEAVGGEITRQEAADYASRSLDALRDLAVSRNSVLDVADASASLMQSLRESSGSIRFDIAEVLSHIGRPDVQATLTEIALGSSGIERIKLLEHASASARMHGDLLTDQFRRDVVRAVLAGGQNAEATAVATLMGSLGLEADELIPLVVSGGASAAAPSDQTRRITSTSTTR